MEVGFDGGSEFINSCNQEMQHLLAMTHHQSTPLHKQSNGAVERMCGIVRTYLKTQRAGSRWNEFLGSAMYSYNSAVCESTGYSPAYLMFGRDLVFPKDFKDVNIMVKKDEDWFQQLIQQREDVVKKRNLNNPESKGRKKQKVVYKIGDSVLMRNTDPRKAEDGFIGSYVVERVDSDGSRISFINENDHMITRDHSDLKKFVNNKTKRRKRTRVVEETEKVDELKDNYTKEQFIEAFESLQMRKNEDNQEEVENYYLVLTAKK